jgi:hypothetical protein
MRGFPFLTGLACALTGALLLQSTPALADEAPDTPPPSPVPIPAPAPSTHLVWYGWQVFLADASLTGLAALAANVPPDANAGVEALAAIGYVVDGTIIHSAHHRYLVAGLSAGMRVLFPILGAGIGAGAASCDRTPNPDGYPLDPCWAPLAGAVIGFLSGMATASIVDAVGLSWEQVPEPGDATAPKATRLWLLPQLTAMDDASHHRVVSVGLMGAF